MLNLSDVLKIYNALPRIAIKRNLNGIMKILMNTEGGR